MYWLSQLAGAHPYSIYHVASWFIHHMSLNTASLMFAQVQKQVPWLAHWTEQSVFTCNLPTVF